MPNLCMLSIAAEATAPDYPALITSALETLTSLATSLINFAMSNPLLSICFVAGTVIPAGFALFNNARRSTRG